VKERKTIVMRRDNIRCPECGVVQGADVTHTEGDPFASWIHECIACGFIIMESEWEKVEA